MISEQRFSDLELSRRLERAEGLSNASFVSTRASVDPDSSAVFTEVGGTLVMYDEPGSPMTQTFCLGLFEPASDAVLDAIEAFYAARSAHVHCEVSPLAGVAVYRRLCERGYRAVELSTVLFRELGPAAPAPPSTSYGSLDEPALSSTPGPEAGSAKAAVGSALTTRVTASGEEDLWSRTVADGWADAAPELSDVLVAIGHVNARRADTICFLAEIDGVPVAAGALSINEGVALLAGASTKPASRGRGAQRALLQARLDFAHRAGCDLAMMGALPGSRSQRNAERQGFRIAYTRTKWQLET